MHGTSVCRPEEQRHGSLYTPSAGDHLRLHEGAAPALQAADYTLLATPQSVEWGYYSSEAKLALTVHSGDTVRIQSISTCGSREEMMKLGVKAEEIPPYTDSIYKEMPKDVGAGGHILTGPVAIAEAEPGDVLEVQILKVDIDVDFACKRFFSRIWVLADGIPLYPQQDHPARSQENDGQGSLRASSCR